MLPLLFLPLSARRQLPALLSSSTATQFSSSCHHGFWKPEKPCPPLGAEWLLGGQELHLGVYVIRSKHGRIWSHLGPTTSWLVSCHMLVYEVKVTQWRPHGLKPSRLLCPWNSPGRNTEVDCHSLLQGIFPIQGLNLGLLRWQVDSLLSEPAGEPKVQAHPILQKEQPARGEESFGQVWPC